MPADLVHVELPVGGRLLVAADLRLGREATAASDVAASQLAAAVKACDGPATVVMAGGMFDLVNDDKNTPAAALAAHPRLAGALAEFAAGEGHRLICIPGVVDRKLAWDRSAQEGLSSAVGATVGCGVEVAAVTGRGTRKVRIQAGHEFDPRFAPSDPPSPADTPFGVHVITEVLPAFTASWAHDATRLQDVGLLPRFMASRLLYRRVGRWAWVAVVPFLLAIVVQVPLSFALANRFSLLAAATVVDLVLVAGVVAAVLARAWRALLGGTAGLLNSNDEARAEARKLIGQGHDGLIVGHGSAAELVHLGTGFFAAAGPSGELVQERKGRFGLPPAFVPVRTVSWVEVEAGAELHVRLWHSEDDAPGATLLERLATPSVAGSGRPVVVASFPHGDQWPLAVDPLAARTRVRRRAATLIAAAGVLDLLSAVTPPLEARLRTVVRLVPLAVPQTATALVTLAGLGLLALARGVRRGQRDAFRVALALLVGSALLHVVKGADVEEAVVAGAVAVYLLVHRGLFRAGTDRVGLRQAVVRVVGLLAGLVVAATAALEVVTEARGKRLAAGDAVVAVGSRLVGIRAVGLSDRLDDFISPALLAMGLGVFAWLAWLAIRPAASRRGTADEERRARTIVSAWGTGTLDYFALRSDKEFFFSGQTVVAYAVHHGVCLVSPDPVGPPWERDQAWAAFRHWADDHGWTLAVLGAGDAWLPIYRSAGMRDLYVGDEAVVDVSRFALDGGRHKSLRQAVNRVAKYGYTVRFHVPSATDDDLREQVRDVMGLSRRGDVERGFSMTLGRLFDPADEGLLLAVCSDPDGRPVAFCQYVPAPGIDGYSLDLMRRDSGEHPNGLLDFVIVETIRHLREHGSRRLSLNFAAMRGVLAGEVGAGVVTRIERWALRRMSGSMQIESLWRFNDKFDPDWEPRYVVYDAPEHVVPVAFAIARAESFWELPLIGRLLVPDAPVARPG
ncbi:MAG: lysyl-tRNA synthetase, class [Acidimicrobiaceae bacterium]|nr:lysyl-tRNA synthetase, class [Acidimicrobiaceae bacterium]